MNYICSSCAKLLDTEENEYQHGAEVYCCSTEKGVRYYCRFCADRVSKKNSNDHI